MTKRDIDRIYEKLEKLEAKMDDLNLILKVFKWIGWAITIAGAWIIVYILGRFVR